MSPSRSRSRTRSRSRNRRSRSRTRTRSRSLSRSPARYSRFENEGDLGDFKKILREQEKHIYDLIVDHKEEVKELVAEKQRRFRQKPLQKQFELIETVLKDLKKIKKLIKKKKYDKAQDYLESLTDLLEEKAEDIQIADSSPHGWLAVNIVRNRSSLPKDLQKKVDKVNSRLDKSRKPQQHQYKRPYQHGQNRPRGFQVDHPDGIRTNRSDQKKTPQELITILSHQKKSGTCSHCNEAGHYYRECAKFWQAVAESRKTNAQASSSNGGV